MKLSIVRSILALLVVGSFIGITAFVAIWPLLTKQPVDLKDYSDYFAKMASVYTGIVGVVVGFYFGQKSERITGAQPAKDGGNDASSAAPLPAPTTSPEPAGKQDAAVVAAN